MGTNILLLSHVYPGEGVPESFTPVVHYFAKEWVKMGHRVLVIHTCSYFPKYFYIVPQWLKKWASKRYKCALPDKRLDQPLSYVLDGVTVLRYPVYKSWPSAPIPKQVQDAEVAWIQSKLVAYDFHPQYVIAHWVNPLYISHRLKQIYGAKSAMILHSAGTEIFRFPQWGLLFDDIDVWGFRSLQIKAEFERIFGYQSRSFRCFSGIPVDYLDNPPHRSWQKVSRYIYVGMLLQRKYPDAAIRAVSRTTDDADFHFDIVGNGVMASELKTLVARLHVTEQVILHGRLPRRAILPLLDAADVFVMISASEVFGLVYLEAMARGCIVIAARNEGMTGIIDHGKNGFLCAAGDEEELITILNAIKQLTVQERQMISNKAMATAALYTDTAVSQDYLSHVMML